MKIDKYNVKILKPICSEYIEKIEYLLGTGDNYESILKAREYATMNLYSGKNTRFKNVEELELYFNNLLIRIIKDVQMNQPEIYNTIIKSLDQHLIRNKFFNKEYGVVIPDRNNHLSPELYYENYLKYKKVLEQILSIIKLYKL